MTLEEKIAAFIDKEYVLKTDSPHQSFQLFMKSSVLNIENAEWIDYPSSIYYAKGTFFHDFYIQIEGMIDQESIALCLTSPSQYIREYASWKNNNKESNGTK